MDVRLQLRTDYIEFLRKHLDNPQKIPGQCLDASGRILLPLDTVFLDVPTDQANTWVTVPGFIRSIVDSQTVVAEFLPHVRDTIEQKSIVVDRFQIMKLPPLGVFFIEMHKHVTIFNAQVLLQHHPNNLTIGGHKIDHIL